MRWIQCHTYVQAEFIGKTIFIEEGKEFGRSIAQLLEMWPKKSVSPVGVQMGQFARAVHNDCLQSLHMIYSSSSFEISFLNSPSV
jgi:hypothetical protein